MTSPATSALWKMRDIDSALGEDLARGTGQPPLVGQLLAARDVKTVQDATSFLQPDFGGLHDPSLLPGMALATARLVKAIEDGETILIHGDYDVDGTTGTSILVRREPYTRKGSIVNQATTTIKKDLVETQGACDVNTKHPEFNRESLAKTTTSYTETKERWLP